MNVSRRNFLGGLVAGGALAADSVCACRCARACRPGKIALQLYAVRFWIKKLDADPKVALAKALKKVGEIGFEGVEFAGCFGATAPELKRMLDDAGLVACGTHVDSSVHGFDTKNGTFDPEAMKRACEFELAYGNDLIICPGEGNFPKGVDWFTGRTKPIPPHTPEFDEFAKRLVDMYNKGVVVARHMGCKLGFHNHIWEHKMPLADGTSYWDYLLSNTDPAIQMEQDVGWTTCAGVDPKIQYKKYPRRSRTLHAKENGMGRDVKAFDGILGQPGRPNAVPVDWDGLFPVTDADGVQWYVVECERHRDDINGAVIPSFEFLKSKGRI